PSFRSGRSAPTGSHAIPYPEDRCSNPTLARRASAVCAASAPPPASAPFPLCCTGGRVMGGVATSEPCRDEGLHGSDRPGRHRAATATTPRHWWSSDQPSLLADRSDTVLRHSA